MIYAQNLGVLKIKLHEIFYDNVIKLHKKVPHALNPSYDNCHVPIA